MSIYSDKHKLFSGIEFKQLSIPKRKIFTFLLITAIVILFYFIPLRNFITDENNFLKFSYEEPKEVKNVLFWTRFFGDPTWYAGKEETGEEVLKSIQCPVTNCFFTHNRNFLGSDLTKFDAIAFHGPEFDRNSVPNRRNQSQLYIFVSLEAPTAVGSNLKDFNDFFNLTMTYLHNSDIEMDYVKVLPLNSLQPVAPSKNPNWLKVEEDFYDDEFMKLFEKKKKNIAWFVSHCNTYSKRENLAKAMQNFTTVDIYGSCGPLKCPRSSQKCSNMLTDDYKFYLSFENSLCIDYVTEKVFNTMNEFIIPIVFNGANITSFIPPKSFINANDFDTVEDLVKYLNFLSENPNEYIKYFWWKKHYKIDPKPAYPYTLCDLCMKLNDKNFMKSSHIYPDIDSWYRNNKCNQNSHIKF